MNVFYGPAMHEGLRLRRKFRLSYKVNKNDPNPHLAASSHIDFFIITERFIIALSCMLSIIGSLDKDAIYYYAATGTKTTERKSTIQCVKGASTLYSLRSMHPLREIETIESKENEGNHSDSKFKVTNKFLFEAESFCAKTFEFLKSKNFRPFVWVWIRHWNLDGTAGDLWRWESSIQHVITWGSCFVRHNSFHTSNYVLVILFDVICVSLDLFFITSIDASFRNVK